MLLAAAVVLIAAGIAGVLARTDDLPADVPVVPTPPGEVDRDIEPLADPYAWDPERADEFVRRATAGNSHVLYALSPGGAAASAERTARWRPLVERAAEQAGVDADTLEGLVFLESAGRPDARAPGGLEAAAGLTQILAETGSNLLGMQVDVAASERYTRRLARAERRGRERAGRARCGAPARASTSASIPSRRWPAPPATSRSRHERLGREDLAFVSYHMGIGNLEGVLDAYGNAQPPYVQLYFDSTPTRHRAPTGGSPRSATTPRTTGGSCSRRARSCGCGGRTGRSSTGWPRCTPRRHLPRRSCTRWTRRRSSRRPTTWRARGTTATIVPFPEDEAVTGLRRDRRMGELARRIDQPVERYRGLRPEALAMALYIGAQVREISGQAPLVVTSTVRDGTYQAELADRNREATRRYSLHTTGWAFDVLREYRSRRQALAFQFVLDRLRSLNAIAWVREPRAIHITGGAGRGGAASAARSCEHRRP